MIEVGQTIGNYTITAKLGEGGMGVVFLAEHPVIGRKVALKAIHPELSRNQEVVSRFVTEAKSVNQIGHEHIVDISDFGNTGEGEFYFIMEFLQGESLADRLRREGPFETNRALRIAAQVADALAASHEKGIVHRDLKPENIFLIPRSDDRDFVKVLDFGLAKLTQGEEKVSHKTRTGSVMGTPYYMAPEQCEGKIALDHRADVYSLGIILFEMMTGQVPFTGEGYGEIIVKQLTVPPPAPRTINPLVGAAAEAVVLRALGKQRDARFQTMTEFRAAMLDPEGFASGEGPILLSPSLGRVTEVADAARPSGALSEMRTPGPRKVPMPSTFRHSVGEMLDEDIKLPRSRRGPILAMLALGAAAAGGFFYLRQTDPPATPPAAVAAPAPVVEALAPPEPAPPEAVTVGFRSEPEGAEVSRKDTGEVLGTTPFDAQIPFGETEVGFVFKRDGFEMAEAGLTPSAAGTLHPSLTPIKPAEAPRRARAKLRPKPRESMLPKGPRRASHDRPERPVPKKLDADAVLEPSF